MVLAVTAPTEPAEPSVSGKATILRAGWLPALLILATVAVVLRRYGVPLHIFAIFAAYVTVCIALPGTLVWRLVHRGPGSFAADVAGGLAVGYALEVITYLPARAVGAPLLVLASPVVVVGAFLAVPGLRRYWRGAGPESRAPWAWSWSLAALAGLVFLWSCAKFLHRHGLSWPSDATPDSDMPFHLAMVGELKHHMPPTLPFVQGEPLYYHWFVYAEVAATSWVTGIEPQTLLYRLSLLPMLGALIVLIAAATRRLTQRWWTGPVAAFGTFFALAPDPYKWKFSPYFTDYFGFGVADDGSLLRPVLWTSPTQTFGALLFVPVVLLLIDFFRGHSRDWRRWALFVVLLATVMGAKATYLPLLLAALLLIVVVHAVLRRRVHRSALIAAGIALVYVMFAQIVLFGGSSQGLKVAPLSTVRFWSVSVTTSFGVYDESLTWRLFLLTGLFILCWVCIWGGVSGLVGKLMDPSMILLLGLGLGGIGAILLLGHYGGSQGFFFQSARPYLTIAAVCGLAALVPRMTGRASAALLTAALAGAALLYGVQAIGTPRTPSLPQSSEHRVVFEILWPYLALAGVAVAVGIVLRHVGPVKAMRWPIVVALLAGCSFAAGCSRLVADVRSAQAAGWKAPEISATSIPPGAQAAGRWLRDHSHPDDLVATNAHCAAVHTQSCDNSHVWVSAYTERRVLVEGWAFTDRVHTEARNTGLPEGRVPFWRPSVLADNDAAFTMPSVATIDRLRDQYHVRWLFVDEDFGGPTADLSRFATLRFRSGNCDVYQINR